MSSIKLDSVIKWRELEVGCGVGNACFPLMEVLPSCHIYAIDFSSRAVALLRSHPEFKDDRVTAAVIDVSESNVDLQKQLSCPLVDFASLIFSLSAISPEKMPIVIRNVKAVLKPGVGRVLFRDYAVGDLAQLRFKRNPQKKKLGDNFYLRGDGTRCYYFTEDVLKSLFEKEGFECERLAVIERDVPNRKRDIKMHRKWIQAVFLLKSD